MITRHKVVEGFSVGSLNSEIKRLEDGGWRLLPDTVTAHSTRYHNNYGKETLDTSWSAVMAREEEEPTDG